MTSRFLRLKGLPSAIYDPELGDYVVPDPSRQYTADDRLVQLAPWQFGTPDEVAEYDETEGKRDSVLIADVEATTRRPGEKRTTRREKR